jgi:hypothetical protein
MRGDDSDSYDPTDPLDDPVARTVLDGSTFHQRRLAVGITRLSQRKKLGAFATVAGANALYLPIALTLPMAVRTSFFGGAPLAATPAVLVVGLVGLAAELFAGVAVAAVSVRARRASLTDREALHLVAIDNVASMAGLGIGAVAVAVALCGFAVGYGGLETVAAFGSPDNGVSGPYTSLAWLPTVRTIGTAGLAVGGFLAVLGAVLGPDE